MSASAIKVNSGKSSQSVGKDAKNDVRGPGPRREAGPLTELAQMMAQDGMGPSMEGLAGEVASMPLARRQAAVQSLQRARGNSFVQRLAVQAKLNVGPAGDKYEQEADHMADQVMRMTETPNPIQRQEDEEEIQTKPLASSISPLIQRFSSSIPRLLQRQEDEEEIQTKPTPGGGSFEAGNAFESRLSATRGGGRSLPDSLRGQMEAGFGADFSRVRVHTGGEAAQLNRSVSAQAFTYGQDIYLGDVKTDLGSSEGQRLLAHELTHVMQQTGRGRSPVTRLQPVIQRTNGALPSITHLPLKTQQLLQNVLGKTTIDEAVLQMYDNIWNLSGWKYNALSQTVNGTKFVDGSEDTGMCEGFRNAFAVLLRRYDNLRKTHPDPAISSGALSIVPGQDLAGATFMTRTGLTLMGTTALRGNVFLEIDGNGNVVDQGLNSINRFVFKGHWTLMVNGVKYDPIFYSIGEENEAERLDHKYESPASKLVKYVDRPIATGEFNGTFVLINDHATYNVNKGNIEGFYSLNKNKIDALVGGSKLRQIRRGIFRPSKSPLPIQAQGILAPIADLTTFFAIARKISENENSHDFIHALTQVAKLADRSAELIALPAW